MGRVLASWAAFAFLGAAALTASGPALAESVAYDSLGRVISVITDDGKQTQYTYDSAGNRAALTTVATGVTQAPVAVDDPISYTYGATAPTFDPRVNDSDPNHLALTIVAISPPQFGTASFTGTSVTYTPPAFHVGGIDAFAYTIKNTANLTASAVIKVTLNNPAPIANPFGKTAPQNAPSTFDPRVNDSDPGGLTFTVTALTTPAHGGATIGGGGTSVTYTPTTGYWGPDSFGYTITNTAAASASSTISMTVTALPPIANPYALNTSVSTPATVDPRTNDSDPNNLPLTITAVGTPSHGTAVLNSGVSVTYTPTTGYSGPDSFSYTIANTGGGSASSTVSVTMGGTLTASVSTTTWNWQQYDDGASSMDPAVVVTVTGGQSPYTYAWQYVSLSTLPSATAPTYSTTQWSADLPHQEVIHSNWRCQVTDHAGTVAYTSNVNLTFTWQQNPP